MAARHFRRLRMMDPADQAPEVSIPEPHQPGANGTGPGASGGGAGGESKQPEQRSFISVIIHSFFIIPFLIAIFAGLLVVTWRILTNEPHSVYDYVADVKVGGATSAGSGVRVVQDSGRPDRVPDEQLRGRGRRCSSFRAR